MPRKRLGEVLTERKVISKEELESAIAEQQKKLVRLGELLVARGVSKFEVCDALETVSGVPYLDPALINPVDTALALVPRHIAIKCCAIPIEISGRRLVVLLADPQNLALLDELRFVTGMEISPRQAFRDEILAAVDRVYGGKRADSDVAYELGGESSRDVEFFTASAARKNLLRKAEFEAELFNENSPAVRIVSQILASAAEKRASDIHLEQQLGGSLVRLRVDGVLRELTRIPAELRNQVISRIKILADMDIAERRLPQDGRFLVRVRNEQYDIRTATLPTQYGEKIVMRMLNPNAAAVSFADLGLSAANAERLTDVLRQPQGMVLVTGPTGSGKTTTLYSSLNLLHSPGVNISTIEDPIEYVLEGINQVQVSGKAGRTFAQCLRSLLRQDPNVIMVGEIRDGETAEIALQAAQTGHVVLSTLHTNDTAGSITRLLDLGLPPFMISASINAVLAQRLVRKLCECRVRIDPSDEQRHFLEQLAEVADLDSLYAPGGCAQCEGTGYRGRIGVFELMIVDDAIRSRIRAGVADSEIRFISEIAGMKSLAHDAYQKLRAGITSLDEIRRAIPVEHIAQPLRCGNCENSLISSFRYCPYCGASVQDVSVIRPIVRPRHRWAHGQGA